MHIGADYDPQREDYYVSWWPDGDFTWRSPRTKAQKSSRRRLSDDCGIEGGDPHVTYEMDSGVASNLAMNEAWQQILYGKKEPSYHVYSKNCSVIVARVLKAGGYQWPMGRLDQFMKTKNLIWVPRDIAEWCDKLCALGIAKKKKSPQCPEKFDKGPDDYLPRPQWSQFGWATLGMR